MPPTFKPRSVLQWFAIGALVALLLVVGLLAFLQTGIGRNLLRSKLSAMLSSGPDQQVVVGRIHGLVPVHLTVGQIHVRDRRGVWLNIDHLVLRWSPMAMLRGRIKIAELSARQVTFQRLPQSSEAKATKPSEPLQLPKSIPPLTIADLHIVTLRLTQEVAGKAADFTLQGKVVETAAQDGLRATLELRRIDRGPSTLMNASAILHGKPTALKLQVHFREAAAGWVSHVLGLKAQSPLQAVVDGDGALSNWRGVMECSAARWGALHTKLDLHYGSEIRLALQGRYVPGAQLIPHQWQALLGSEASLALQVRMLPSQSLTVKQLQVQGAGFQLQADARVDLHAQTLRTQFKLAIKDLQVVEGAVGVPVAGSLALQGKLAGPWKQPLASVSLQLQHLKTAQLQAKAVTTTLQLEPAGALTPHFGGLRLTGSGQASGLRSGTGKPLPEKALHWSLQASLSPQQELTVKQFSVTGAQQNLQLTGHYNPVKSKGDLDAILTVSDLRSLSALLGEPIPGTAELEVHLAGQGKTPSATGRIEGFIRPAEGSRSSVNPLLSPEFKFSTDFNLQQGTRLTVSDLHAESKTFRLTSRAQLDLHQKTLQGDWQLSVANLQPLSPVVGKSMAGSLHAEGTLTGPLNALQATARVQGRQVHFDKVALKRVLLTLQAKDIPAAPQGDLRLELVKEKTKLLFTTRFFKDRQELGCSALHLQGPGAELKGDLKVDLRTKLLQGSLTGRWRDLSRFDPFTGQTLGGSGELQARFNSVHGGQDAVLRISGTKLTTPFVKAGRVRLSANLKDLLRKPQGSADVELSGVQSAAGKLARLTFHAAGDEQGMRFRGYAKGRFGSAFELQTRGVAVHAKAMDRLRVEVLRGRLGSFPVRMFGPATFQRAGDRFAVDGLDVGFGSGRLQASGRMTGKQVGFQLTVTDWPLQAAALVGGPKLHGTAAGRLQVAGAAANPDLQVQLHVTGLRGTDPSLQGFPSATITARARLRQHLLQLQATLQGPVKQPARVELQLPVKVSLAPVAFAIPADGAIRGHVSAQLDLFQVSKMLLWDTQEMSGQATADLDIGGRLAAPQLNGSVTVSNAEYQNYVSGTVLKGLNAVIRAQGPKLEIAKLEATDGGKGKLSGSGRIELDAARHFPMDLQVALTNATLVRRDDVTGTANGKVEVAGSLQNLAITGKLKVTPVEVDIPDRLPADITELNVIEIHDGQGAPPATQRISAQAGPPVHMRLNLGIDLPRRIFVRGRGLDSEWEGKLRVTGTAQAPVITGKISVVRGHFNFLNRRFKLVSGTITFYGGSPPSPHLNLTAEADVTDMTAQLVFSGSATNPKLELTSTPPLASDEILARLLFRRSTAELTPTQALKLASALQQLTGLGKAGPGLNLMERTRKFLGLDELDFQGSNEGFGKGTVGVGKYLSDNIYLNLQKGIGEKTDKATVEIEITPHISVESELQSDASSGIGINWKYDY